MEVAPAAEEAASHVTCFEFPAACDRQSHRLADPPPEREGALRHTRGRVCSPRRLRNFPGVLDGRFRD
jgi:hypothetical protein